MSIQLFHFNGNENNLFIAIQVKLLNLRFVSSHNSFFSLYLTLYIKSWGVVNFKSHFEAFESELFYLELEGY